MSRHFRTFDPATGKHGLLPESALPGASNTQTAYLTSDWATSSTTLADVTGMSFTAEANGVYLAVIEGFWKSASIGDGIKIAITGPSSPTLVRYSAMLWRATSADNTENPATAFGTTLTYTAGPGTGEMPWRLVLTLRNGANAGAVTIQVASEIGNSVTLIDGCSLLAHKLN